MIHGEPVVDRRMSTYMQLRDDELLCDYGITDGSTILLSKAIYYTSLLERRRDRMGDRDGRNQSMECVAMMLKGSDVSRESAPHPQPAAVKDLHKDSC